MTNVILAATMIFQIVTNWGPAESGNLYREWRPYAGGDYYRFTPVPVLGDTYQQVGSVESQEVLRVELQDGTVASNILKNTRLRTITLRGHRCPDVIWDTTNDVPVVQVDALIWTTNSYMTISNAISNAIIMCNTTGWGIATFASNTYAGDPEVKEFMRRAKLSWWGRVKEWWRK